MLGKRVTLESIEFSDEMIRSYLAAVGDTELPVDEEGPYAPPLMGMAFVGDLPQIRLQWGSKGYLAGQVFWPKAHIRPGDKVTTTSKLIDVYEKTGRSGKLVFIVWESELIDQSGKLVALCRRSFARQE